MSILADGKTGMSIEPAKQNFELDRALGYGLLRATLGVNISLHGITRIAAGTDTFAASLARMFHATVLPPLLLWVFANALPWLEATVGLLILFGLFTRYALAAGASLIVLLTFGTGLRQDWPTASLQLSYALVFGILLVCRAWNRFSVDGLLSGDFSLASSRRPQP
jgi:thiosulfate dehydrogenase [quinone] large subunit